MKSTATISELYQALTIINEKYDGNISFNEIRQFNSKKTNFTLKAISGKKGARTSHSGRNMPKASWHVHGDFFDALFAIRKEIVIESMGKKITVDGGNWEDSNIGSMMNPMYFSETSIN